MTDERVAEVLARHGVAPDASSGDLIDALRRRGWHAVVGEGADHVGHRRATAMAWRTVRSRMFAAPYRQTLRATKPTEAAALGALLVKALEREG